MLPKGGFWNLERHHSEPSVPVPPSAARESIDLLAPIQVGDRNFRPLVRETLALQCGLKILFLRKEPPGRVYQGGDMDNRLKTLFDALAVPRDGQIVADPTVEDPIFCLCEDDGLIKRIDVDTQRLLSRPNSSVHDVHLVIEVDVRPTESRLYNQPFLGE
jgi:hypothetical protein